MRWEMPLVVVAGCLIAVACAPRRGRAPRAAGAQPPVAKKVAKELEKHGHVRLDDYYWLKERENPEVLAFLEAENDYTQAVLAHTEAFQESLLQEIVGRIKEDDQSAPYKHGDYYYYERFVEDGEYPIYCRRKGSLESEEQIMLNVNELAAGHVCCGYLWPPGNERHPMPAFPCVAFYAT